MTAPSSRALTKRSPAPAVQPVRLCFPLLFVASDTSTLKLGRVGCPRNRVNRNMESPNDAVISPSLSITPLLKRVPEVARRLRDSRCAMYAPASTTCHRKLGAHCRIRFHNQLIHSIRGLIMHASSVARRSSERSTQFATYCMSNHAGLARSRVWLDCRIVSVQSPINTAESIAPPRK